MTYFDCFAVGSWMFAIGVVFWSHLRAKPEAKNGKPACE
jgi:hypothetical protein